MYHDAITQLTISAETLEHNAPIYDREGNAEQADYARAKANAYRAAITALRGIGEERTSVCETNAVANTAAARERALAMAMQTPGVNGAADALHAAKMYEAYLGRA